MAEGSYRHGRSRHRPGQRPPRPRRDAPAYEPVQVPRDVAGELRATARPGKGDILVKVFADAAAAFRAGDFERAVELGTQAKHIALRSASVRELLGISHYRRGEWRAAARELAAFKRLTGSNEQNPVLADCYRGLGRPDKALELCDEVGPGDPPRIVFEAAIVAAGALSDQGKLEDALTRIEQLDLRPETAEPHHVRAWYALGDLLERRGRFSQACDWFEAAAATDPELTDAADRLRRLRRA